MLIDHLVYAVPDLAAAVAEVEERFGVRAHNARHPDVSGDHRTRSRATGAGHASYLRDRRRTPRRPGRLGACL